MKATALRDLSCHFCAKSFFSAGVLDEEEEEEEDKIDDGAGFELFPVSVCPVGVCVDGEEEEEEEGVFTSDFTILCLTVAPPICGGGRRAMRSCFRSFFESCCFFFSCNRRVSARIVRLYSLLLSRNFPPSRRCLASDSWRAVSFIEPAVNGSMG